MSLYNKLFGVSSHKDFVLRSLGITSDDVPRFRDAYIDEEDRFVIHTRTGGGNREDYEDENDHLTTLPGYLFDDDDDFDSTYANFFYSIPDELKQKASEAQNADPEAPPKDKWAALFAAMAAHKPQDSTDKP